MLTKELIKKIHSIEIRTSRMANDQLAGSYHSIFKGRGMTFSEVRQYQPGDDVRFIDWNVSARMNDAYVKIFTEEREMTVMLLVDISASHAFGSKQKSKAEIMAEVAALLAFSAIKNNDRVGLVLFSDQVEKFIPPQKGRGHVMRVIAEILTTKAENHGTHLRVGLDMLGKLVKRRAVTFLISDFLDSGYEKPLRIAAKKHDLIPIEIFDPQEHTLPPTGLTLIEDLESGETVELDLSSKKAQALFNAQIEMSQNFRKKTFKQLSLDHILVDIHQPYLGPLVHMFRNRERRMRRFG